MHKHIIIAGSGFGGWYTALSLLNNLPNISITIIGSSKIPKLLVGESLAFDAPYNLKRLLHLDDDRRFMKETGAIYKYAIEYNNINGDHTYSLTNRTHNLKINALAKFYTGFDYPDYYEPYNIKDDECGVVDAWIWDYQRNKKTIDDYTAEIGDAFYFGCGPYAPYDRDNRFVLRPHEGYAYHMDADKTAEFLKAQAAVKHAGRFKELDAVISAVEFSADGSIDGLVLDDGTTVKGDLYCDLTGFKRLLISKMPNTDWVDRSRYFPDSAMVTPTHYKDPATEMIGATQFFGEDFGWRFRIKLYHRIGNGYLFKSDMIDNHVIGEQMRRYLGPDINPTSLKWHPGYYKNPWSKNVVAMGLAAGLIDAFDGNNVSTHSRALENIIAIMEKDSVLLDSAQDQFNHNQHPVLEEIDLRLHMIFAFSSRSGPFWQLKREQCKEESLLDKLELIITRKMPELEKRMPWNWQQQYVRIIAMTGLDISKFDLKRPNDRDLEMVRDFWHYNRKRNQYIQTLKWPNYYEWLKNNRFDGLTQQEFFDLHQ